MRVLLPDKWAFLVVSLLAVWITLWAPQCWKLLKPCCSWLVSRHEPIAPLNMPSASHTISGSRVPEEAFLEICPKLRETHLIAAVLALVLCAGAFTGFAAAGTAISYVTSDSIAPATSSKCAMLVPNASNSVTSPMGQIMESVESYYSECYEAEPSQQECDLFPDTDLFVNFTSGVECPFNGDICLPGQNSTISLDTGYLDSKYLGINSPHRPIIRRKTTCAPLVTNGFYDAEFDNITSFTYIQFKYGPSNDTGNNATYLQTRSIAFEQIFSPTGYDLKTVSTALGYVLTSHNYGNLV